MTTAAVGIERSCVILSDSTGGTAARALAVAAEQHPRFRIVEHRFSRVRTIPEIHHVVTWAREHGAMIVFTLAAPDLRQALIQCAAEQEVAIADVLAEVRPTIARWFGEEPRNKPGHMPNAELLTKQLQQMEAIFFSVRHDDGENWEGWKEADCVLVGLSRAGKTPVCSQMALQGLKVANLPIVSSDHVLVEVLRKTVDPRRVFALVVNADELCRRREKRQEQLGGGLRTYADREYVRAEVAMFNELLERNPEWARLSLGRYGTPEEAATDIIDALRTRFPA